MLKEIMAITFFLLSFSSLLLMAKHSRCQMQMSEKYAFWSSQVLWAKKGASRQWHCDQIYLFEYNSNVLSLVSSQKTYFYKEITR